MPDITLRPRDASRATYDQQAHSGRNRDVFLRLYARDASRGTYDVQLWPAILDPFAAPAAPGGFPTQYAGLRIYYGGAVVSLCLVATADAPAGMGGQLRIRKGATTYAVYLVETTDPNASSVRIRTTTGTKSIRLLT